MTRKEAQEIVSNYTFDIDRLDMYSNDHTVSVAQIFDSREEAEKFIEALGLLTDTTL